VLHKLLLKAVDGGCIVNNLRRLYNKPKMSLANLVS